MRIHRKDWREGQDMRRENWPIYMAVLKDWEQDEIEFRLNESTNSANNTDELTSQQECNDNV